MRRASSRAARARVGVTLHRVRRSEEDLGPAEGGDVAGRSRQLGAGLQRGRAGGPVELGEGQLAEGEQGAGPAARLGVGMGREGPLAPAPAFGQVSPQPGVQAEVTGEADGVGRRVGQRRRHGQSQVGQLELQPVVPCGALRVHVVRFGACREVDGPGAMAPRGVDELAGLAERVAAVLPHGLEHAVARRPATSCMVSSERSTRRASVSSVSSSGESITRLAASRSKPPAKTDSRKAASRSSTVSRS